ncbi:LTA synthase family protein [Lapidilactobacillus bayanensis]|uniref:LTA synthase family protein n=1 Tax=Lapidilactobacillus bayanensis TaxID=2485998 RepID=UPI0013DDF457|nr:alkaline phosphatase family protein [Lapidilactobacillus bayanensis]
MLVTLFVAYHLAPASWTKLFTTVTPTVIWLIVAISLLIVLLTGVSMNSILVHSKVSLLFTTALAAFVFGNQAGGVSHDWWGQGVKYSDILTGSKGYFIGHLIWKLASVTVLIMVVEAVRYLAARDWPKLQWHSRWVQIAVSVLLVPASFFILQASNFQFQLWSIAAYQDTTSVLLVLALNIILLAVFYWTLLALINRYWIGNGIYGIFIIVLAFANDQKMLNRFEPILPMDLQNIVILPELVKMVGTHLVMILVAALVIVMVGLFWIQYRSKLGKLFRWQPRLSILIAGIAMFTFWIFFLPSLNPKWEAGKSADISSNKFMAKINYAPDYIIDFQKHFRKNGEVLGFLSLVRVTTMDKPANYSEARMTQLAKKYRELAQQINKKRSDTLSKQTVIYVLSESLANPDRIPGVKLKTDPIPYIDSLKKQDGGLLYSLGYGGGTANVEFETLTSLSMNNFSYSMTIPYVFLVPKLNFTPTVIQSYSTKNAIHPYTARTYSRSEAFKKFGFQDFYTRWYGTKAVKYDGALGHSEFTSDASSFKDVLELLQEKQQSQFIQLSTMQNHMPYNQGTYDQTYTGLTSNLTKDSEDKLKVYTQGLKYTDEAVKEFIGKISKIKRHVTVVFFGDHLPGFYEWQNGNTTKIAKYENILHQSDYFIYSNFKTKKVARPVASANMFTPMMLKKTDSKVSPYYAMLTKIAQTTPANELGKYMNNSGEFISSKKLTEAQKEILRDYQLIQYDVTTGKKYLNKTNFYKMPK